ncbi:MotE family protein [Acetobacter fallax]|uniref:Magnesium transporter MgtE intracellular domain-containing protein n=1 Tax=Acetobacter fallax TaxID=1737473 RepID=A0ABX0K8T6_9PROT|nr:hypothetical protein [Acetobacter fallax]NHO31626.1 hypothetical protein [Acetobacter fallax]NHO35185.1 hypothetical protein [Acetobacter fallax]
MPKVSFPRIFQLSACLMGGLFCLKVYLLTSSFLFANTPAGAADLAAGAAALSGKTSAGAGSIPQAQVAPPAGPGLNNADGKVVNPCSGLLTCVGQVSKPELDIDRRADDARQALRNDLAGRTHELDEESRRLDDMKRTIEASQVALDVRMQKYSQEQLTMTAASKQQKQLSDADIDRLVKIYEAMAPRDAASIFNVLDFQVLVPVMTKMNPRKASAILAGMSPDRAMMATQLLAGIPRKVGVVRVGSNG